MLKRLILKAFIRQDERHSDRFDLRLKTLDSERVSYVIFAVENLVVSFIKTRKIKKISIHTFFL